MEGEANGQAKLTADQVRQIYKLAHEGSHTQAELGAMFGVSATTICHIKHRVWWRHLWSDDEKQSALPDIPSSRTTEASANCSENCSR